MNTITPVDVEQTRTPGPDDVPDDAHDVLVSPDVEECDSDEAGYGYGV